MRLHWFYLCFVNVEFRPFGETFRRNVSYHFLSLVKQNIDNCVIGVHFFDPRWGYKANVAILGGCVITAVVHEANGALACDPQSPLHAACEKKVDRMSQLM